MFSMSQRNEIIFLHAGDENLDSSACLSYDCSVCIRNISSKSCVWERFLKSMLPVRFPSQFELRRARVLG